MPLPGPVRFPNESDEYRAARDALTEAEHELTRAIEAVAAQRRALPDGGVVPRDYAFAEGPTDLDEDGTETTVTLSELFGPHESLLLYSFMFGPNGDEPCPMCTSLIDGYDGASDLTERAAFAVVAASPIARLRAYGRERRWTNVRLLSSAGSTYNRDYQAEDETGQQNTTMNVFTKRDGKIRHFYGTEKGPTADGEDDRHLDLVWPLWNLLDLTPEGRGRTWRPSRPARR